MLLALITMKNEVDVFVEGTENSCPKIEWLICHRKERKNKGQSIKYISNIKSGERFRRLAQAAFWKMNFKLGQAGYDLKKMVDSFCFLAQALISKTYQYQCRIQLFLFLSGERATFSWSVGPLCYRILKDFFSF